jgi:hypothetical protein
MTYVGACEGAAEVCLGVPYFNWGPSYVRFIRESMAGKWIPQWIWLEPDWKDINNPDSSNVGFVSGPALSASARQALDAFIKDLGSKKIELFKDPSTYQDGSPFLKKDEIATEQQICTCNSFCRECPVKCQIRIKKRLKGFRLKTIRIFGNVYPFSSLQPLAKAPFLYSTRQINPSKIPLPESSGSRDGRRPGSGAAQSAPPGAHPGRHRRLVF